MSYENLRGGIPGTTTNDSAAAGAVGQYISSYASGINSGATGAWADMTSISLTAGDWDVSANVQNDTTAGTTTNVVMGIGLVSGNDGTGLVDGDNRAKIGGTLPSTVSLSVPPYRLSLASTTTVYLKHFRAYTGTATSAGRISARRVR